MKETTDAFLNLTNLTANQINQLDAYFTKKYGRAYGIGYQKTATQLRFYTNSNTWGYVDIPFIESVNYVKRFPFFFNDKFVTLADKSDTYVHIDVSNFSTNKKSILDWDSTKLFPLFYIDIRSMTSHDINLIIDALKLKGFTYEIDMNGVNTIFINSQHRIYGLSNSVTHPEPSATKIIPVVSGKIVSDFKLASECPDANILYECILDRIDFDNAQARIDTTPKKKDLGKTYFDDKWMSGAVSSKEFYQRIQNQIDKIEQRKSPPINTIDYWHTEITRLNKEIESLTPKKKKHCDDCDALNFMIESLRVLYRVQKPANPATVYYNGSVVFLESSLTQPGRHLHVIADIQKTKPHNKNVVGHNSIKTLAPTPNPEVFTKVDDKTNQKFKDIIQYISPKLSRMFADTFYVNDSLDYVFPVKQSMQQSNFVVKFERLDRHTYEASVVKNRYSLQMPVSILCI